MNVTKLRADLRSVRSEEAPGGGPRLISLRTKEGKGEDKNHGEKTHADRFWAGALASTAVAGGIVKFGYEAAPRVCSARTHEGNPGDGRRGFCVPTTAATGAAADRRGRRLGDVTNDKAG